MDLLLREIKAGNIAAGVLFRSNSPIKDVGIKKAKGEMAIKAGIKCVINLDDNDCVLENLSKEVPWYYKLVMEKKVIGLRMTFTIPGVAGNEKKLKTALQFMIAHEGPYLIHCFAGIDRTGFVVALLEALMGASLVTICEGYLAALNPVYGDSYGLDHYSKTIIFQSQLKKMAHSEHLIGLNLQTAAENYLLNDIGLSPDEVTRLKGILSIKSPAVQG